MKSIRLTVMVEHPFVFDAGEDPVPLNDLAKARAYEIHRSEIPPTTLTAATWKVPEGAEMSVPDKCADALVKLGYAEGLPAEAPAA